MNIRMGNQLFLEINVPLLWGTRAVLQHADGRLSVIDLSGEVARTEILADEPNDGVAYEPTFDGYIILEDTSRLYSYSPQEKQLTSMALDLPDCQVTSNGIRVGSNLFSGNVVSGVEVGIGVTADSVFFGGPLPENLARLVD